MIWMRSSEQRNQRITISKSECLSNTQTTELIWQQQSLQYHKIRRQRQRLSAQPISLAQTVDKINEVVEQQCLRHKSYTQSLCNLHVSLVNSDEHSQTSAISITDDWDYSLASVLIETQLRLFIVSNRNLLLKTIETNWNQLKPVESHQELPGSHNNSGAIA